MALIRNPSLCPDRCLVLSFMVSVVDGRVDAMTVPPASGPPAVGTKLTRVPGRSAPRALVLEEVEEAVARLRRNIDPALWPLLVPKAEDQYRWRIQLECGCVREVLTRGKDAYPDQTSDRDPLSQTRLPAGQYWCSEHEVEMPFREIVEWLDCELREFPADPKEPQHGLDPDDWAKIRRTEPKTSALWTVKLACGHRHRHAIAEPGWKPEDGPRLVSQKRAREMCAEYEEYFSTDEGQAAWPEGSPRGSHAPDDRSALADAAARARLFRLHTSKDRHRVPAHRLARSQAEAEAAAAY